MADRAERADGLLAIGLMSGTSMDGIDVALIETDGEDRVRRGPALGMPYPPEFQARLRQVLEDAKSMTDRDERPGLLAQVERELTERHAEAVLRFLREHMPQPSAIDVIGFHGQTVLHRPERRLTVQLGDGPLLARLTGIDVVHDLRAADVAAGGQGAPLVPVYHRALLAGLTERVPEWRGGPACFVNIGGIANVTWIGRNGSLLAFDTGPGNALLDKWALRHAGRPFDEDGRLAGDARPDAAVLEAFLGHPYFSRRPPKSLDRNDFLLNMVDCLPVDVGARTLAAITATAIAHAQTHFPEPTKLWVIAGGGRKHPKIMDDLRVQLGSSGARVLTAEEAQLDGDSLEAEAWAYLAVRSVKGMAITFPGTTGVPCPLTGGKRQSRGQV